MAKQKTEKTPRKKQPKQTYLPGAEPPHIQEINEAADDYRDARDKRMSILKDEEIPKQELLTTLMHKHGLQVYEYDGYIVSLQPKEKCSVKRKPGANGEAEVE